jgi:hypothetical protein
MNLANGVSGKLGRSCYLAATPQGDYFGCNGNSDHYRDSIDGNPVALFVDVTASVVDNPAFSLAPISRCQQFSLPPMPTFLYGQPQRAHRAATKWLSRLNPPVGINRKVVRHPLNPCLGSSKRGRLRKMRRHRSSPYNSPFKMPRQRLRECPSITSAHAKAPARSARP